MPHSINIDGTSESLFLLQNLGHASPSFCSLHKIRWGEAKGGFDWDYYFGWLKSIVCEHLIQVSIKLRMLEDILKANDEQVDQEVDFASLDASARQGLDLGRFHEGTGTLTLREAWNKVIHATDTQFDWDEKEDHEAWSGTVWLSGSVRGKNWKVELNVEAFSIATSRYLDRLESNVDWHHLYKYDR